MKHKTETAIIISCAIVIAFSAVIALASVVLFSGKAVNVGEHLTVGSLNVGFYRTSIVGRNSDGEFADDRRIDLKTSTDEVFRTKNFCPTDWCEATFEAVNNGKVPVALDVSISTQTPSVLAEQLQITITTATKEQSFSLASPPESVGIGSLGVGEKTAFSIKVELPDRPDNNTVMGESLALNLHLSAVQLAT